MKRFCFFTLFLFSMLFVSSCSQDDDYSLNEKDKTGNFMNQEKEAEELGVTVEELKNMSVQETLKRKAGLILSNYVSLDDFKYSLDISKQDAETLGVSSELYDEILKDLNTANAAIAEARSHGVEIQMTDIKAEAQKFANGKNRIKMRSGNKGKDQYGSISTNGTEFGIDYFLPEISKTHVLFRCRTAAAITPVYTCKTYIYSDNGTQK